MKTYKYKELKDATLLKIYTKYGNTNISLIQFRDRIYKGKMTIEEALTIPLAGSTLNLTSEIVYITALYNKLCQKINNPVTRIQFIIKMSKGYSPEIAILRKYEKKVKEDIRIPLNTETIIKELKKQENKEKKEHVKKRYRTFTKIEESYIKDINLLDSAFNKIKTKQKTRTLQYAV